MRRARAADPAAGRLGIFATSPRRTAHGPEARARARSGRLATRRVRRTTSRFRYAILGVRGNLLTILRGFRHAAFHGGRVRPRRCVPVQFTQEPSRDGSCDSLDRASLRNST